MSAPALLALAGILAGTLCLVLRRAEARVPDPEDTSFRSPLGEALVGWIAWISVVPMAGTLAILASPLAGLAALGFVAAALALPTGARLVRLYRAQVPLAALAFVLSFVSGMSIVTQGYAPPETP